MCPTPAYVVGAGVHCLVLPFKIKAFLLDIPLPQGAFPHPIVHSLPGGNCNPMAMMLGVHWLCLSSGEYPSSVVGPRPQVQRHPRVPCTLTLCPVHLPIFRYFVLPGALSLGKPVSNKVVSRIYCHFRDLLRQDFKPST